MRPISSITSRRGGELSDSRRPGSESCSGVSGCSLIAGALVIRYNSSRETPLATMTFLGAHHEHHPFTVYARSCSNPAPSRAGAVGSRLRPSARTRAELLPDAVADGAAPSFVAPENAGRGSLIQKSLAFLFWSAWLRPLTGAWTQPCSHLGQVWINSRRRPRPPQPSSVRQLLDRADRVSAMAAFRAAQCLRMRRLDRKR
jgi:hypothetical protein